MKFTLPITSQLEKKLKKAANDKKRHLTSSHSSTLHSLAHYKKRKKWPLFLKPYASMEPGSSSDRPAKPRARPGPWPPRIEPFVPANTDFNPRDLKSWAKRTGFSVSGESSAAARSEVGGGDLDLEKGPRAEIETATVRPKPNVGLDLSGNGSASIAAVNGGDEGLRKEKREKDAGPLFGPGIGPGGGRGERDLDLDLASELEEHDNEPSGYKKSGLVCGVTENPGYG